MSKLVRVKFRDGEWALQTLPDNMKLSGLWEMWRRDGFVLGDSWCAQFDDIARVQILPQIEAERPSAEVSPLNQQQAQNSLARLDSLIVAGEWKPSE